MQSIEVPARRVRERLARMGEEDAARSKRKAEKKAEADARRQGETEAARQFAELDSLENSFGFDASASPSPPRPSAAHPQHFRGGGLADLEGMPASERTAADSMAARSKVARLKGRGDPAKTKTRQALVTLFAS